jgi:putative ABC transport system permease protein
MGDEPRSYPSRLNRAFDSLSRDLQRSLRASWMSPGFALSVILSIGVGVGANTTVFAWMDNIVRNPFPAIPEGGALVALNVADAAGRVDGMPAVSYPVLAEWRARTSSFSKMAGHALARLSLRAESRETGQPIWAEIVAPTFFDTLGVKAAKGRLFDGADEDSHTSVVVLSDAYWKRRFGGAPEVVGRSLLINGIPLTVVGIGPTAFGGVVMGLGFDVWVPVWQQTTLLPGSDWLRDRTARRTQVIARLKPGISLPRANEDLLRAAREVSRSSGETPLTGAAARRVSDTQLGSLMGPLGSAMMSITAIVLLTACANVAGLLLARAVRRQKETAIQLAMGAPRGRLIQQSLVQGLVLALLGGLVGLWIAQITKGALVSFIPQVSLPVNLEIQLNLRVALFALGATTLAALLFSLLPALRSTNPDVASVLRASSAGVGVRRSRFRQGLVVTEVAFSLVSLVIAGLFLRSAASSGRAALGFKDPSTVLLVSTDLSFTRLEGPALDALVSQALERVRGLLGVKEASLATFVPLGFGGPPRLNTRVDGYVPAPDESMLIDGASVSDRYFETMGIPLVEGRFIEGQDQANGQRVAVVNEAFGARFWPGQSAIGRRISQGQAWSLVAGVVRDSAIDGIGQPPRPMIYYPWSQRPSNGLTFHLRAEGSPLALVEPIRRVLAAVQPDLPALDPGILSDHMRASTFVQSVGAAVFSAFGGVALMIAALGLYGVVAQFVAERQKDIAVTVALGAPPHRVARLVFGPALRLTILGLCCGSLLSVGAAILVRNQLPGLASADVITVVASVGVLFVVALGSCAWPTWRALRIDPGLLLRIQ